jgi:hypothetical protein
MRIFQKLGLPFGADDYSGVIEPGVLRHAIEQRGTYPTTWEGHQPSQVLRLYCLAVQAERRKIMVGWA